MCWSLAAAVVVVVSARVVAQAATWPQPMSICQQQHTQSASAQVA
jgi:hypothetical protein